MPRQDCCHSIYAPRVLPPVLRRCRSDGPGGREVFVPCWWARTTEESALTFQSTSPAASASARTSASTRSQVPSPDHLWCRFHTVCHGPKSRGRSRHGIPGPVPVDDPFHHRPVRRRRPPHLDPC